MTANVITYRGKSAEREVGKALGFDEESLDHLSNLVSNWEWRGKTDTMAHTFQNAGFDIQHPRIAKYLDLSMRIQGLPRHLGQDGDLPWPLESVVPLERASMPHVRSFNGTKKIALSLDGCGYDICSLPSRLRGALEIA